MNRSVGAQTYVDDNGRLPIRSELSIPKELLNQGVAIWSSYKSHNDSVPKKYFDFEIFWVLGAYHSRAVKDTLFVDSYAPNKGSLLIE